MATKIIHLDTHFSTGELTVQPVMLWANGRPCYEGITKHASVGAEYFKTIEPRQGHSFVYVLALGAWETYGENRNGDSFPEFPYMEHANPPWIAPGDTLVNNYKSFEQFGHNYRHHKNKDPKKAVGKVMKAFWNPYMHRVELLIDLEDAKAPDLAERIASGDYPPVSMGTKVPYDVCSICGNRAPTRRQYCDHLKFQMKDVIKGKKVHALNPRPKFFDISWVFRPADRTAFMMKKVAGAHPYELISGAEAGEYLDNMEALKQAAHKMAVIDKIVQGIPVDAKTEGVKEKDVKDLKKMRSIAMEAGKNTPDLPDSVLKDLSKKSLPAVTSSLMAAGMIRLSTPEMTKVIMYKAMPNKEPSKDILDKAVRIQQGVLGLFEDFPQITEQLQKSGALDMGVEHVDPEIVESMSPYIEKRAGIGEYLQRRFVPETYRNEIPNTTRFTLTDPATGGTYMTTRGAAIRAHDEIAKRNLYKVVGGGLLLGGAYKALGAGLDRLGGGKLKPLAALGLGALGVTHMPSMGKHYMTDQGVPIPTLTEMQKVSAAESLANLAIPVLGTLGTMAYLSHDYQSRLRSGVPIGYEHLAPSRKMLDYAGQFAHEHPILSALGGTIAARQIGKTAPAQFMGKAINKGIIQPVSAGVPKAKELLKGIREGVKLSSYVEDCVAPMDDTVLMPEVDMDKLAERIGWIVVEG